MNFTFTSSVTLLDSMGSDLTVANAARVSFGKSKEIFDSDDERLIRFLAKNNHWTPFAHPQVSFHIKCPIAIAAQLKRHQIGGAINEISRRYVRSSPEFVRLNLRKKPDGNIKQGSGKEIENPGYELALLKDSVSKSIWTYERLIEAGVAPEQARFVLPQGVFTEFIWTGSLYFFSRVCNQRMANDAQKETAFIAMDIADNMMKLFPCSWENLIDC